MAEPDDMMTNQRLEKFFVEYEARTNRALDGEVDIEAIAEAFSDCFMGASPNGVMCSRNDEKLRAAISQGMEFYRSIGTKSMEITSISITSLDDYHSMVRVYWRAFYEKKDGSIVTIDFDVVYLLQIINEKIRIFAYITGDEQKVLHERGLIQG